MQTFLTEIRQTLVPGRGQRHGPLPPLLVAMTVVTGLVDAFSYLTLGHVFVANMTGNVVFLGFALAGAPGFSVAASVLAVAAFGVGAVVAGRIAGRLSAHRAHLLGTDTTIQAVPIAAAVPLAAASSLPITGGVRYGLIALLGSAMGLQNAAVRKLAVPDLTTTVLTLTITGIAADSVVAGGRGRGSGRRWTAVVAMFVGALVGAVLVIHSRVVLPLVVALVLVAGVAAATWASGAGGPPWVRTDP